MIKKESKVAFKARKKLERALGKIRIQKIIADTEAEKFFMFVPATR